MELRIQEFLAWNAGILQFGIRPTIGIPNPTSNDKEFEIQYLESGILESKTVLEFLFKRGAIFETPCSCLQKDTLGAVISL